jgi:hypothetical protein
MYAETPDKERTIKAPKTDDMAKLAGGDTIELEKDEKDLKKGKEVDTDAIPSPGGTGEPVVFEED